jgi:hypothetical protein
MLVRPGEVPDARVQRAIRAQTGVELQPYLVVGTPAHAQEHRWQTIASARNDAKRLGVSPWVMFLDDDVELALSCVERLRTALVQRPGFAALAADYLAEGGGVRAEHVAMGATLFRREALEQVQFRSETDRCECQCCCDDLRRLGWSIGYLPGACATHLRRQRPEQGRGDAALAGVASKRDGRVLVAFDSRHYDRFVGQFLLSLRANGNNEVVTVMGYGLLPEQTRWLERFDGVELFRRPHDGRAVPIRRVEDFQRAMEGWHAETPVAYWDAGDVIIQTRLDELWSLVRANPDKLLAVREPHGHPKNLAVSAWTTSIHDAGCRKHAYDLLTTRPFLNSGFAAGTAASLMRYFQAAHRLMNSPALSGTSDWGDQTALNLYCHSGPENWQEVDEIWNYCLYARRKAEIRYDGRGRAVRYDGTLIAAVHGTAGTLRQFRIRHTVV